MGAQSRLLAPSVPFRFFIAAAVFHVVAWALLAVGADQVPDFAGGPGPVLASVHALTLGVLAMTAMGASFQMLPVATGQSLIAVWPVRAASWLYVPGVAALVHGMFTGEHLTMAGGAVLAILALVVFAILVGDVLRRTRGMTVLVLHGWLSLAALLGLMVLGLASIADLEHGFIPQRENLNVAHMILAIYGFMGMLALGYSYILVPMFALSQAPAAAEGVVQLALSLIALAVATGGAAIGSGAALVGAAGLGLAVSILHLRTMLGVLGQGMRKNLGLSFVFVKVAWGLLPAGLLAGGLTAAGLLGERGAVLFGFLALFGWLLTFLLGMLQRILPFLAAMNAAKAGQTPPRLSQLTQEIPLKFHAACHFTALALVSLGIVLGLGPVVLLGAFSGLAGSLAFLWFAVDVARRMLNYKPNENSGTT